MQFWALTPWGTDSSCWALYGWNVSYRNRVWGPGLDAFGSEQEPMVWSCKIDNETLRSKKDSAFLRQKNEYRLLKYFALRNSKADARLGVLVAELLKIRCFRDNTPCRQVLWLHPRRTWGHPASYSMDTVSPTPGVKQPEREINHSPLTAEVKNELNYWLV